MLRDLRHRAEFVGFAAVHGLIRRLPHRFASGLGRFIGRNALRFGKRRRLMVDNLRRAFPDRDENELTRIANQCSGNIGASFFEEASATRFEAATFSERFSIDGWNHIEQLEKAGERYLMVTAHFGPFDFVVYPLAQRLGPINIVIQTQTNPYTRARMDPMREHIGAVLIPKQRAGAKMLTLVRKSDNVGLAIDQRVRPWDGILIPFLGRYCWTSPVPALVCQRTKCPAVPVFCQPDGPGRYRLLIREPIWPHDLGEDPTYELTCRHHQSVEREILRAPERWFWIHDRWRLVWQHTNLKSLARLRRESGLPELERSRRAGDSDIAEEIDRWFSHQRLEDTANAWLQAKPPASPTQSATAAGWRILERGYAVRYRTPKQLSDDLDQAEQQHRLQLELRKLDPFPLLILEGPIETQETKRRVLQVVEHRRDRGSVLLSGPDDPEVVRALAPEQSF